MRGVSAQFAERAIIHLCDGSIDIRNPAYTSITLVSMARGVATEPRYSSQCPVDYKVGEHLIYASVLAEEMAINAGLSDRQVRDIAAQALLHDAHEGIGYRDLASPIKKLAALAGYNALEDRAIYRVMKRYGLPTDLHSIVKIVDKVMFVTEVRDVWGMSPSNSIWAPWVGTTKPTKLFKIKPLDQGAGFDWRILRDKYLGAAAALGLKELEVS